MIIDYRCWCLGRKRNKHCLERYLSSFKSKMMVYIDTSANANAAAGCLALVVVPPAAAAACGMRGVPYRIALSLLLLFVVVMINDESPIKEPYTNNRVGVCLVSSFSLSFAGVCFVGSTPVGDKFPTLFLCSSGLISYPIRCKDEVDARCLQWSGVWK
jgi:TctA family transporter